MEKIRQLRLDFLEETINHYNINNRCVTKTDTCLYSPIKNKSKGCAIGRHIRDKKLCKKLDKFGILENSVNNDEVFDLLPKKLQRLGQSFLIEIQNLHDYTPNWNETGLSEQGKIAVKRIKKLFCYAK